VVQHRVVFVRSKLFDERFGPLWAKSQQRSKGTNDQYEECYDCRESQGYQYKSFISTTPGSSLDTIH